MSLTGIAKETLQILEKGEFISKHGNVINFTVEQQLAEKSTKLYRPDEVANLFLVKSYGHDHFDSNILM